MTTLTPTEFVKQEFPDISNLSPAAWLRKMQEYAALTTSKVDIDHLLNLDPQTKKVLQSAVDAIYFRDNSDYLSTLYEVVSHLTGIDEVLLTEGTIESIHQLFQPI